MNKMKRFMLVLMVALVGGISKSVAQNVPTGMGNNEDDESNGNGQSTLVATLAHGTNITMFYGEKALEKAHKAAYSGDIITLSGGEFTGSSNRVKITKAVIIRGTGIDVLNPTIVSNMEINIPSSDTCCFSMEGVRISGGYGCGTLEVNNSKPCFLKCLFSSVRNFSEEEPLFVNCKLISFNNFDNGTAKLSHCYVHNYSGSFDGRALFINSIVSGCFNYFDQSSFVNSILCYNYGYNNTNFEYNAALSSKTVAMNCVAILPDDKQSYNNVIYSHIQDSQISCFTSTFEHVFKDYSTVYSDSLTFELTDEAKTEYKGTDGTEIGLYGGQYPYNSMPAYPRITKLNVAKQTTIDNKLSVEIEVSASE